MPRLSIRRSLDATLLGRAARGAEAICVVQVDERVPNQVLQEIRALPWVKQVRALAF